MTGLLTLIAIGSGALLVLVGLLMIAPQVRVHQIRIYSPGSWLFRVGMLLTALGVLLARGGDAPKELLQVGQLIGVAGIMGGVITAGHEYHQAKDHPDILWDWWHSLTLQMLVSGVIVLLLASLR